jgi:two-component system NtrC family sensor kinase
MTSDLKNRSTTAFKGWERVQNLFRARSLYSWLVGLLLTLSLSLFLFVAWIIFSMSNSYLEDVTTRCGKRMSTLIDRSIRTSMITKEHAEVAIAINKVVEIPGISAIRIYDHAGNLKYHTLGANVDENPMPTCDYCHKAAEPSTWGMPETCVYTIPTEDSRKMIVLSPIISTPGCVGFGCHQINRPSDVLGYMEIELPLKEMDDALSIVLYEYFAIVIIFLFVLLTAVLWFFNHRINKPLKKIVEVSRAVTAGNMSVRVQMGKRELADIHQVELALNTMLESIKVSNHELQRWSNELESQVRSKSEDIARSQNEIYQIERLASLGRLSSSVAHEINNPLAGILTYAKLVSKVLAGPPLTDERKATLLNHLHMIQSETARCGDIVKGLLNFSRDGDQAFDELNLNEILEETHALIQHSFQIANVRLVTDFSASQFSISGNGNQIIQACLAVLSNALEAVPDDGTGVVTYRSYNQDLHHVTVEIRDNGIGISAEDQDHIFEPFFSRKKEMSGIGLGLAVTYGILEQHQAKITVESAPGAGTSIKFIFRLLEEQPNGQ